MNKKQNAAETIYRLSVLVLDSLLKKQTITSEEYDSMRIYLAYELDAPIGLFESENALWKKEL